MRYALVRLSITLALAVAMATSCHPVPPQTPPGTSTGFVNCTEAAIHTSVMNLLDDVASALATQDWRGSLAALVSRFGLAEVACAVQAVAGSAAHNDQMTKDPLEATKAERGRQWLAESGVRFAP